MDWITKVINEWDPLGVMHHAPDDEYEMEIGLIKELLLKTRDIQKLAIGIRDIFNQSIGSEHEQPIESYEEIAKRILKER